MESSWLSMIVYGICIARNFFVFLTGVFIHLVPYFVVKKIHLWKIKSSVMLIWVDVESSSRLLCHAPLVDDDG
jgi:hypothetical protein